MSPFKAKNNYDVGSRESLVVFLAARVKAVVGKGLKHLSFCNMHQPQEPG